MVAEKLVLKRNSVCTLPAQLRNISGINPIQNASEIISAFFYYNHLNYSGQISCTKKNG